MPCVLFIFITSYHRRELITSVQSFVGAAADQVDNVNGVDMNGAREGIRDFFQDLLEHGTVKEILQTFSFSFNYFQMPDDVFIKTKLQCNC